MEFATKPVLARRMLARALDAGVPAAWVTADEAYGGDSTFRSWLEDRRIGYVVAVPANQTIPAVAGTSRADMLVPMRLMMRGNAAAAATAPRDPVCSTGPSRELRTYADTTPPGWRRWLLARRSLTRNSKSEYEVAYYLCYAPTETTDDDLIQVAGARWAIEDCFQTAKTEVGLDHHQTRRYDAWYRHVTRALLAHTYLAVTAAIAPKALAAASSRSRSARSSVFWHT